MKWLIIKSKSQIRTNTPDFSEIVLLKHKNILSFLCTEDFSEPLNFEQSRHVFAEATHIVIMDESYGHPSGKTDAQYCQQIFLLGKMAGRNIPVYCINMAEFARTSDCIRNFSCAEEMAAFLNKDYDRLEKEDSEKQAALKLFESGIPVTVDCFANNIAKDNLGVCKLFKQAGFDVNSRDALGTPMLNLAVRNEQEDIIDWLLDSGVDINACSVDRGYSAVMDAVWKSNEKIIEKLILHGADLKFLSKEGQSILVLAVGIGNVNICKILVQHGADPDIKDSMGMSAYEYSVLFKKNEIIDELKKFHKEG